MIKRILVGLAGTTYTPTAIKQAVALAKCQDAELTGVTVLDVRRVIRLGGAVPPPWVDANSIPARRMAISETRIAQSIRDFETACQISGIKHRVEEETGDPFTKLVALSRYHDLMVFGLRSAFEFDFLSGTPESLLIRLVAAGVRPVIAAAETSRDIGRVLIAYSGSIESAKAMKRFVQLRLWPDAELKIVTFRPSQEEARELMQDAENYCREHGYRVCHQANSGDPKLLLLSAATIWNADMIVMGNGVRSVLLRKVLGDTLLATLRDAQIPLFLAQ